jgi:hypothetical protein
MESGFMIDISRQREPESVGEEFGGRWIAWDNENLRIVSSAATPEAAKQNALAEGISEPTLEFVPPSDAAFVGGV